MSVPMMRTTTGEPVGGVVSHADAHIVGMAPHSSMKNVCQLNWPSHVGLRSSSLTQNAISIADFVYSASSCFPVHSCERTQSIPVAVAGPEESTEALGLAVYVPGDDLVARGSKTKAQDSIGELQPVY